MSVVHHEPLLPPPDELPPPKLELLLDEDELEERVMRGVVRV